MADGSLVPYPNKTIDNWDGTSGQQATSHFVCVQSVVADAENCLWILDPASPLFQGVVPGGVKLPKVNLTTDAIERVYHFDDVAAPRQPYLNDVRIAHGSAFISDSGLGAIVTVNLSTGNVRRLLADHPSTKAEPSVELMIEGRLWKFDNGATPQVHSDGIAIHPQLEHIYYKALTGRTLYRVPVAALLDEGLSTRALAGHVERVAQIGPTDGLEFDGAGNLYVIALEENAIKVLRPDGRYKTVTTASEYLWPDTISISGDRRLVFTATQFHRIPAFNGGVDKRKPPYDIFRLKLP